jgi:FkbM family methyltransferase
MNLTHKLKEWRELATATNWRCVGFDILNLLSTRLRWKSSTGVAVPYRLPENEAFYVRLGTTDWSTFRITFVFDEYGFVGEQIPTLKTVVDLGANIGDSTRYFMEAYPGAEIVAIEPDLGNFEMCRKNVARLTKAGRVNCKQCFVGAEAGHAGVDRSEGEWSYAMDRSATAAEKIPVVTMSDLMQEFHFSEVDLLKVDIEGAEVELFQDCSGWISRIRHIAIETQPPYSVALLEKDLAAAGAAFVKLHHAAPDGYHELALFRRADVEA